MAYKENNTKKWTAQWFETNAPMVAETYGYQYNADAFEDRGGVTMKMEPVKEVSKIREDKAR